MPNVVQEYDASNLRNHNTFTAIGLTIVQDANSPKAVYRYDNPNTASTSRGHGTFIIAPNYLGGNVVIRAQYRASANTGAVGGTQLTYTFYSQGGILGSGSTNTLSPTSGAPVPGTAGNIGELVYTITGSVFTPGTMYFVPFYIGRSTTDTAGGFLDILSWSVEYAVDITFTKQYAWLPSSVWMKTTGSPASLGAPTNGLSGSVIIFPYTYQMADIAGNAIGLKYTLPSTFTGNLKYYTVGWTNAGSGNLTIGTAMGEAAVGANFDPTLTASSQNHAIAGTPGVVIGNAGAGVAAPISPAANSTLSMQVTRDNTDSNTGIFNYWGTILEYDVFTASPSPVIQFNPTSLAPPASLAATLLAINDANNSGYIVRYTQGVVNKICGKRQNPGTYSSGGTFVGFVKTPAASGNLKYHLEFANPAVGAGSDPALTSTATVSVPVTGANQMLRFVIDISPGLVAFDEVIAMIVREGDTDGVLGDSDYVNGWMEVGVLP